MKKILLIAIFGIISVFVLDVPACAKNPVSVKTKADKTKITIGDRIKYTIDIEYGKDVKIGFFDAAEKLKPFEIKKYDIKSQKSFGRQIQKNIYTITSLSTGRFLIPAIEIKYELPGNSQSVFTDTIPILVESVLSTSDDTNADVKDIKPPVKLKNPIFLYILIIAAAGVSAFIAWRKLRKKEDEFFKDKGPGKTPYELARERLKKLEGMDLLSKGEIKQYYIILSEIIRRYIEGRYAIPAVERTTAELYQEMRQKEIERKTCTMVKELLDEADLVKFAKFSPSRQESGQDLERAYELLELTKKPLSVES